MSVLEKGIPSFAKPVVTGNLGVKLLRATASEFYTNYQVETDTTGKYLQDYHYKRATLDEKIDLSEVCAIGDLLIANMNGESVAEKSRTKRSSLFPEGQIEIGSRSISRTATVFHCMADRYNADNSAELQFNYHWNELEPYELEGIQMLESLPETIKISSHIMQRYSFFSMQNIRNNQIIKFYLADLHSLERMFGWDFIWTVQYSVCDAFIKGGRLCDNFINDVIDRDLLDKMAKMLRGQMIPVTSSLLPDKLKKLQKDKAISLTRLEAFWTNVLLFIGSTDKLTIEFTEEKLLKFKSVLKNLYVPVNPVNAQKGNPSVLREKWVMDRLSELKVSNKRTLLGSLLDKSISPVSGKNIDTDLGRLGPSLLLLHNYPLYNFFHRFIHIGGHKLLLEDFKDVFTIKEGMSQIYDNFFKDTQGKTFRQIINEPTIEIAEVDNILDGLSEDCNDRTALAEMPGVSKALLRLSLIPVVSFIKNTLGIDLEISCQAVDRPALLDGRINLRSSSMSLSPMTSPVIYREV